MAKKVLTGLALLAGLAAVALAAVWNGSVQPAQAQSNAATLTATVHQDRSVDLTLSGGPSNWWFVINGGTCTAVSGPTVSGIKGYKSGYHSARAFSDRRCYSYLTFTGFTIPSAALSTTVNNNRSVDLTLSNWTEDSWWFRINNGSCTEVSGNTISGISGYQSGKHSVQVYSDSGCRRQIAAGTFTIPTVAFSAQVNNDKSVNLTLSNGPDNWWFRIGWGTCTAVSGTAVNGISGYKSGTYSVNAYSNSGCNYRMAATSFTIR